MKNSLRLSTVLLILLLAFQNLYAQNDLCENAITLTPEIDVTWFGNSTTGTFSGATIGSPAPTCAPNSSQDVWYKFVASATLMTVSLQSSNQNHGIQVFEGSCSGPIMGCLNLQANQTADFASDDFVIGNTYYVRVFNSTNSNPLDYEFEISILQPPPPVNDLCENAMIEEPCSGTCAPLFGTFHGATITNPSTSCAPNALQDVWVKFKADHENNLIIAFANSSSGLDIALEIYEGSCTGPLIACVNNTLGGTAEQYRATNFVINQTYFIRVLNANAAVSSGNFSLAVWYNYFPVNDLSTSAELITPNPSSCNMGTFLRTSSSTSIVTCGATANLDVWYKFVPSTPGMTVFLQPVTGLNHGLQILEGSPTGNSIACVNANASGSHEVFTFNNYSVGQTYYIRVFNVGSGHNFSFEICITNNLPPTNDDCPNATVLTPSYTTTDNTRGYFNFSTLSTTSPSCAVNASQDVWYQFNATTTTMSVLLSRSEQIDIGFQIFQGNCNGSIMGCINTDFDIMQSTNFGEITLNNFVVGQTYFVRVFNASGTTIPSTFHITLLAYPTPANDFCTNAVLLTPSQAGGEVAQGELNGSTINSSSPSCTGTAMGDVWYKFVATTPITTISLYSFVSGFNLGYELFQSTCAGQSLYCSNNTVDGLLPILTVGQTYYVRVFNTNSTLTSFSYYFINLVSNPPPINDLCTEAINITPTPICTAVSGSLSGATLSGSNSTCLLNSNQDLWYKFTAVTPTMTINLYESPWSTDINQAIELYEANCNGQPIACGSTNSSSTIQELIYTNFTIGQTYYFRILSANTNLINSVFSVCVTYVPPPTNDLCESAVQITPQTTWSEEYGTLFNSTISTATPTCSPHSSQDVWYSFVATNTILKINLQVYNATNYGIEVFQENCSGNSIACVVNNPQTTFDGFTFNNYTIGQTYYIRVFNTAIISTNFGFNLCIIDYPVPSNDLCSNATSLTPSNSCTTTTGIFAGSTLSSIANCTAGVTQDVWYQFVATHATMSVVLAAHPEIDLGMEVKADSCNGISLGCLNENPINSLEKFNSNSLTVGQTYFIRVFHLNPSIPASTFEIFIQELDASPNDSYQNATVLAISPSCNAISGNFIGSSLCSPPSFCNEGALQDVWYEFVATTPLTQILVSPDNDLDLGLEIFNDVSGMWMYPIQCLNSATAGAEEQSDMNNLTVGQKYWIRVLNLNNSSSSDFEICVQEHQIPLNDSCENATNLIANTIPTENNATLNAATILGSLPTCTVNNYASCDVWFTFTANHSTMTVSMPPTNNLYAGLAIYPNGCDTNEISCANYVDMQGTNELTLDNYVVGNTYFLRVFGESGYTITPTFKVYITSPTLNLQEYALPSIALFPSPTRDNLYINIPENQNLEVSRCSITNALGQNLFNSTLNNQKVDVSGFSAGVYQVLLETNQGNWIGKFIKE